MVLNLAHYKKAIILRKYDASWPFIIAASWSVVIQVGMAAVGTFIVKRFSTPFSVGFLLGVVIFVAQQHLMLSVTFWHVKYGDFSANFAFSSLSFSLFVVYGFFGCILFNYRQEIMVAPIDAKGFGKRKTALANTASEDA